MIGGQATQRASDRAEVNIAQCGIGVGEGRGVREVETLDSQFAPKPLGELEFTEERKIQIAQAGAVEAVAPQVSEMGRPAVRVQGLLECRSVKPEGGAARPRDLVENSDRSGLVGRLAAARVPTPLTCMLSAP